MRILIGIHLPFYLEHTVLVSALVGDSKMFFFIQDSGHFSPKFRLMCPFTLALFRPAANGISAFANVTQTL